MKLGWSNKWGRADFVNKLQVLFLIMKGKSRVVTEKLQNNIFCKDIVRKW